MKRARTVEVLVILALICIGAFFRFYRLPEVPIGLWRDEAANGLEALRVLESNHSIFFGTREPMFIYLVSVSVALLGRSPLAVRVVAAIVGTATIPVAYLLVRELFISTERRPRVVACLTGLWLATSYWHINFSRLGFRGILLPLLASLSFYFLWRGWNELTGARPRRSPGSFPTLAWFAVAGLCFGLTIYTYTPSRFLPFLVLPFLGHMAVRSLRKKSPRPQVHDGPRFSRRPLTAFAAFGLCFLLVFAPLGAHFVTDARSLFVRPGVSVFNVAHDEPLMIVLGKNALRQLGMFGFVPDPNTRHNPAARPAFDLFTLAFFLIGLAVSLRRCRHIAYSFVLTWTSLMLLPAILTFPELPHSLRAIGALPVAYVLPALGVETVWHSINAKHHSGQLGYAFTGLLALSFAVMALLTYRDYFEPAVDDIELVKAFDPRFVEIASIMDQLDEPRSVWIIPVGPHGEQRMAYFVIDFLYGGKAPHRYVRLHEATVAQELSEMCQGKERALVLNRTEDYLAQPWYDLYSDSKGLIPFLLDKHAHLAESLDFNGLQVLVYELPPHPTFCLPDELEPLDVNFAGQLKLTGAAWGLGPGQEKDAWLLLRWEAGSKPVMDYWAEVALLDGNRKEVLVANKPILSDEGELTTCWEAGQVGTDYYTLSGLPEPASGHYNLSVAVHAQEQGAVASKVQETTVELRLDWQLDGPCGLDRWASLRLSRD